MHLGYNWLISQKTVPINAPFVKQQAMAPRTISRYRPVVSDIRFITLQISLMYGFTGK